MELWQEAQNQDTQLDLLTADTYDRLAVKWLQFGPRIKRTVDTHLELKQEIDDPAPPNGAPRKVPYLTWNIGIRFLAQILHEEMRKMKEQSDLRTEDNEHYAKTRTFERPLPPDPSTPNRKRKRDV